MKISEKSVVFMCHYQAKLKYGNARNVWWISPKYLRYLTMVDYPSANDPGRSSCETCLACVLSWKLAVSSYHIDYVGFEQWKKGTKNLIWSSSSHVNSKSLAHLMPKPPRWLRKTTHNVSLYLMNVQVIMGQLWQVYIRSSPQQGQSLKE